LYIYIYIYIYIYKEKKETLNKSDILKRKKRTFSKTTLLNIYIFNLYCAFRLHAKTEYIKYFMQINKKYIYLYIY